MMQIQMQTSNAAFRDENGKLDLPSVARTLHEIADKVDAGKAEGVIIDVNGNAVGKFKVR